MKKFIIGVLLIASAFCLAVAGLCWDQGYADGALGSIVLALAGLAFAYRVKVSM